MRFDDLCEDWADDKKRAEEHDGNLAIYDEPTFNNAVTCFTALFRGQKPNVEPFGLSLSDHANGIILQDTTGAGGGRYVIRKNGSTSILLQAPHSRSDMFTGDITARMFEANPAVAASFNTLHRGSGNLTGSTNISTLFNAFTAAFLAVYGSGKVVQIHGFEPKKHGNTPLRAIVSGGQPQPTQFSSGVARAMKQHFQVEIGLYGSNADFLGATQNATFNFMKSIGHPNSFLHIEMDRPLRMAISTNGGLRSKLWKCLVDV